MKSDEQWKSLFTYLANFYPHSTGEVLDQASGWSHVNLKRWEVEGDSLILDIQLCPVPSLSCNLTIKGDKPPEDIF